MGVLVPVEGGRWMVTLSGAGRDHPPTDADGFLECAPTLRAPVDEACAFNPIYG